MTNSFDKSQDILYNKYIKLKYYNIGYDGINTITGQLDNTIIQSLEKIYVVLSSIFASHLNENQIKNLKSDLIYFKPSSLKDSSLIKKLKDSSYTQSDLNSSKKQIVIYGDTNELKFNNSPEINKHINSVDDEKRSIIISQMCKCKDYEIKDEDRKSVV